MKALIIAMTLIALGVPAIAQRPAPNAFSDRLAKLDDLRRRAVLRRAVLDSGQRCNRVGANAPQGRWRNLVMWNARCERGGDYAVFIGPDASVQVRPCGDLAKLKLPTCRALPVARPR